MTCLTSPSQFSHCVPDAFLHQIHTATDKLKRLGEQVKMLMETKVSGIIHTISNFSLYDFELAFSKTWVGIVWLNECLNDWIGNP